MTDPTPVYPQRKHHRQAGAEACRQKEPSARKSLQRRRPKPSCNKKPRNCEASIL